MRIVCSKKRDIQSKMKKRSWEKDIWNRLPQENELGLDKEEPISKEKRRTASRNERERLDEQSRDNRWKRKRQSERREIR